MTAWEKGFSKEAALGGMIGKIKSVGQSLGMGGQNAAHALKAADRAVLKASPKGGYAAIDATNVNKNFNVSGFQQGTKLPKR